MAVSDVLSPAGEFASQGLGTLSKYSWVLWILGVVVVLIFIVFFANMLLNKKKQWTHRLRVRRVGKEGLMSNETETLRMRRFPLIKRAEVFELEKPLLGAFLMPELDQYSGINEYSIILDQNNRIYTNTGEYFQPDKSSVNVSAKHSEIDISRADLRADYQNINKTSKRVEWAQIAKFAMVGILIIAIMIVSIKGIEAWGDAQDARAQSDQAQAAAMNSLAEAMQTVEGTMNTGVLTLELLKEIYNTNNLQPIIRSATNGSI